MIRGTVVALLIATGSAPLAAQSTALTARELSAAWGPDSLGIVVLASTQVAASPDGVIAIAVESASAVAIVSSEFRHLHTIGRSGDGPGEFRRITALGFVGDTLWAFDSRLNRVQLFDGEGELLETRAIYTPGAIWAGPDRAGGLFMLLERPDMVHRTSKSIELWRVTADQGESRLAQGDYPDSRFEIPLSNGSRMVGPQPFTTQPVWSSGHDGAALIVDLANGEPQRGAVDLTVVEHSGELTTMRVPVNDAPISQDAFDAEVDRLHGAIPDGLASRTVVQQNIIRPESAPRVRAIAPATGESFWIQMGDGTWVLSSPSGEGRVTVELPARAHIVTGGRDRFLVVAPDDLDRPMLTWYGAR